MNTYKELENSRNYDKAYREAVDIELNGFKRAEPNPDEAEIIEAFLKAHSDIDQMETDGTITYEQCRRIHDKLEEFGLDALLTEAHFNKIVNSVIKADLKKTTLSKVCKIANKIRSMSRSEAFIKAWEIVKAGSMELPVKGVSFGNRQEALRRLATYSPEQIRVFIMPEPGNPVDRKAAAVMAGVQNGRGYYCIGYLPKEYAPAGFKAAGIKVLTGDIHGARIAVTV